MNIGECAFKGQGRLGGGVTCSGPVIFTAHDKRGCRDVCFAHAKWLMNHSMMAGHGSLCPRGA